MKDQAKNSQNNELKITREDLIEEKTHEIIHKKLSFFEVHEHHDYSLFDKLLKKLGFLKHDHDHHHGETYLDDNPDFYKVDWLS
jgi:hypothetical protein